MGAPPEGLAAWSGGAGETAPAGAAAGAAAWPWDGAEPLGAAGPPTSAAARAWGAVTSVWIGAMMGAAGCVATGMGADVGASGVCPARGATAVGVEPPVGPAAIGGAAGAWGAGPPVRRFMTMKRAARKPSANADVTTRALLSWALARENQDGDIAYCSPIAARRPCAASRVSFALFSSLVPACFIAAS